MNNIDNNAPYYPISVAADLCETPVRMLREYEKQGLIRPVKLNGRRMFTTNEIGFIKDIRYFLTDKKMTINGLKEFYLRAACWEIKQCYRRACPAYRKTDKQCWQVIGFHKLCDKPACPACPIYIIKTASKGKDEVKHSSHFAYELKDFPRHHNLSNRS